MRNESKTHLSVKGRNLKPFNMTTQMVGDAAVAALADFGIHIDPGTVRQQLAALYDGQYVGDANSTGMSTAPSVATPVQFLQTWLPGFVNLITAVRTIDDLVGIKTVGSWEDQEIVQGASEPTMTVGEYGDDSNLPLASWNVNFERRTIVRGEAGARVGLLEEARSAAMRLASAQMKRQAAAVGLEIFRNAVGFYGWNGGNNRTFGLLNDPSYLAALTSAGAWASLSASSAMQGIVGDIRTCIIQLRTQSQGVIDPEETPMTLVLPLTHIDRLSAMTDFGITVRDWLKQVYPKIRIKTAPEFNMGGLDGSSNPTNILYLFADEIDPAKDGSTDGGETFAQLVQTKFMTLGVEKRVKSYVEGYSNATAGVMCKRPYAVVRMIGI